MAEKDIIQDLILNLLDKNSVIEDSLTIQIASKPVNQLEFLGVLNALKSREMVNYVPINIEKFVLTPEGQEIRKTGSHEARVFNAVPTNAEGISIADMTVFLQLIKEIGGRLCKVWARCCV
jgi:phenylalanyl-tRNA synthetase alpha chain